MSVNNGDEQYWTLSSWIGAIVAAIAFVGSWIYCVSEYGYLLGFGLGWLPSAILAGIAYPVIKYLWPFIALWALYFATRH